jgi:hypothetical protein
VGQTLLAVASLKNLPRVTAPVSKAGQPPQPQANIDYQLQPMKNAAPFDVEDTEGGDPEAAHDVGPSYATPN